MAPFGKKSDKQWAFLGVEVTDINNLTSAHIRSIYGLGPGLHSDLGSSGAPSIFSYCGNQYSSLNVSNSTTSKGSNACSASRCKDGNPHCLNHMGQDQWEKDGAFDDYFAAMANKPNPEVSKRAENSPSGMKNLGATCYANSLLQVWFHDLAFRDAIYRCRFDESVDRSMNALYQLQLLFVHLDRGMKYYYNPLSLVNSLKLDTATQQDAQEFCNLFMARIDNQLQKQPSSQLSEFITNQFQGHYSYNTTCKNCKTTSTRDCTFYELMLNIKDNCTLMDCLEEFVEAEDLVGADRYSCSLCGSLQDASRAIKLEKLPNVLNIQLMRFVYDSATWTKKKSKDTIKFPSIIDLSELLGESENVVYELTAVLVHSGSSAHSGHFLAYVLDKESDKWFVLNDEEVAEFHGTKFDPEEHSEVAIKSKPKKNGMKVVGMEEGKHLNTLSSRNAYMLTYSRRSINAPVKPCPPVETLEIVSRENSEFESELQDYAQYKEKLERDFEKLREERRGLYRSWHVTCDEDKGCYVSTESLVNYMRLQGDTVQTIDSASLCCEHGKLSPVGVLKSKRISESAKELLEQRDQIIINPVLTDENICTVCTRDICQDKLYSWMHRRDVEEFERKAKAVRSPMIAWVSKTWLADWLKVSPRFHPPHGTTADDPGPTSKSYMPDVLCPHSRLTTDKTKRKLINKAALEVLTRIFGSVPLPYNDTVECAECRDQLQPHLNDMKDMAARAASEKSEFAEMIMRGARIRNFELGRKYYVVSQVFLGKWLDYIKRPTICKRPTMIDNTSLICKHGLFVFDLDNATDAENDDDIAVINEEEWLCLHAIYGGGPEVMVTRSEAMQLDNAQSEGTPISISTPDLCRDCRNERILDFSSTTLIIRVYSPGDAIMESNGAVAATPQESTTTVIDSKEAQKAEMSSMSLTFSSTLSPVTSKRKKVISETGSRRSKRTKAIKKPYKEIKIVVSKWDSVMDVKLKIMQKTDIVPLYQKLVHGTKELDGNERTIADLEIPPYAVLDVIAFDQRVDDLTLSTLQDETSMPGDEGGFGGTGLTEEWL